MMASNSTSPNYNSNVAHKNRFIGSSVPLTGDGQVNNHAYVKGADFNPA
jgi:hypothetical protein